MAYADKDYCVYAIKNINTGKKYIGSTLDYQHRLNRHFSELHGDKHHSIYLQRSFNKHGEDAFIHYIIERNLSEADAHKLELKLISDDYNNLYNVSKNVSGGDLISYHPNLEEIKEVHRQNAKERWENPIEGDGLTEIRYGNKNGMYGKTHTAEARQKISEAHKGRKHTKETRRNMSEAQTERYKDPKEREKVSQGLYKRYSNPEERAKTGEANRKRFENPKERERFSRLSKQVWDRPGHRDKMGRIAKENGEKIRTEFIYCNVKYKGISNAVEEIGISRHTLVKRLLDPLRLDCYYVTEPNLRSESSKLKYKQKQEMLDEASGRGGK